jgi:DNA-binding MarR family transcriptional regulator
MLTNYHNSNPNGGQAETAFRAMLRVYGLIGRIMQPYFGRLGISGSQWGVLRTLFRAEQEGKPGLRILELGNKLLVRPPSVSGLVNRLSRLGLVEYALSKADLRAKEVHLTGSGRELVRRVLQTHGSQIDLLMKGLTEPELQQLTAFMDRIGEHLGLMAAEDQTASPHPGLEFPENDSR